MFRFTGLVVFIALGLLFLLAGTLRLHWNNAPDGGLSAGVTLEFRLPAPLVARDALGQWSLRPQALWQGSEWISHQAPLPEAEAPQNMNGLSEDETLMNRGIERLGRETP